MATNDHVLSGFFAGAEGAQVVAKMAPLIQDAIGWKEVVADFGAKCGAMNSLQDNFSALHAIEDTVVDPNGSDAGGGPIVSWLCVCTDELFFVLAGDINVLDCQCCWARREEVSVVVKYGIWVIIIAPNKLIGITIQLGGDIKLLSPSKEVQTKTQDRKTLHSEYGKALFNNNSTPTTIPEQLSGLSSADMTKFPLLNIPGVTAVHTADRTITFGTWRLVTRNDHPQVAALIDNHIHTHFSTHPFDFHPNHSKKLSKSVTDANKNAWISQNKNFTAY
eukprot:CAMPEP_0201215588 /NCGR_PEP_ID=MMETSP0851-20130426/189055_1 /ASSEMBLY_ACC=CAM_ASM_000631 /TAXON_ID=183588 /ORGANISM="Pseudo-nitzschia fraudulenta, Strain WWA7" /LENGTH=276 /DNA_ID=CAMNT_0047505079 /DNA_START=339 /DNA_END=1172 /DNA_ORIENTATION=-